MSQCCLRNHQIKLWCLKVVESTEFGYSGDKQPELHWYPKDMGKVYLWYTDPVWLSLRLPPLCHQHNHLPAKSSCPLASGTINELSWVLSEKSRLLSKAKGDLLALSLLPEKAAPLPCVPGWAWNCCLCKWLLQEKNYKVGEHSIIFFFLLSIYTCTK